MWGNVLAFIREYRRELIWVVIICTISFVVGGLLQPFYPMDSGEIAKIMHLGAGIVVAWAFWFVLEKHQQGHLIHPIWFALGCLWGASGLFFIRWGLTFLGIEFLRRPDTFLYAAFPDWDSILFGIGRHRNILFHSVILPIALMLFAIHQKRKGWRDFGIGLTIGVASHLVWDVIHGPFNSIRHLDFFLSALWLLGNAAFGIFFSYFMVGKSSLSFGEKADMED